MLEALIPVFLIIALGATLKRSLLREESHWVALERLTYFILFPALITVSIARAEMGEVAILEVTAALLGAIAVTGLALVLARRMLSRLFRLSSPSFTSVFQGAIRWNTYIALAVSSSLAGPRGLAVAAVGLAVMIPTLNTLSVMILARHGDPSLAGNRSMVAQILRNPFVWSCALGAALNAAGNPVPAVILTFADILGRSSLALGLLVVGAGLRISELYRPRPVTWFTAVVKLAIMPSIAVALGWAVGLRGADLLVIAVASSVPSAPNGYVLARQMGGDAPLLAEILTIQTVLAVVTMPIVVALVSAIA